VAHDHIAVQVAHAHIAVLVAVLVGEVPYLVLLQEEAPVEVDDHIAVAAGVPFPQMVAEVVDLVG